MTVLVDTPVWSFAYRRAKPSSRERAIINELASLIQREESVLIGAIRQEVLSGISDATQFENVRTALRSFPELAAMTADYERAATLHNVCRQAGIQGAPTDFLICSITLRYDASVFTTDRDFEGYAKITGVRLHQF
jgi:predicted nucleic acid-binding protein